jgi:ABC-type phosphate transport system substrate-binding protein
MKNIVQFLLIGLLAAASLLACAATTKAEGEVIAIIVPKASKLQKLDAGELSLIFLRKKLYSSEGKRIIPINLPASHNIRKRFSSHMLGSLPETQAAYWNEAYYQGITPPHVVASEDAAIRFVEITPSAIAYVDACKLSDTVKALAWIGADGDFLQQAPILNCPE